MATDKKKEPERSPESLAVQRAEAAGQKPEAAPAVAEEQQEGTAFNDDQYTREQLDSNAYDLTGQPAHVVRTALRRYVPEDQQFVSQDEVTQAVDRLLSERVEV
jgi:ABC-type nitrate/sulfonate/bicarbonate transport system substrate-binding protein